MKRNEHEHKEHELLNETLAKNHACYVLITCGEPSEDGNMDVKMSYEGDTALAAFLLQGAQTIMDEEQEEEES